MPAPQSHGELHYEACFRDEGPVGPAMLYTDLPLPDCGHSWFGDRNFYSVEEVRRDPA